MIRVEHGGEILDLVLVEIRGDKVRLGVKASKSFKIHRLEVWKAINGNQPE